jgi:hypothetical protein
MIQLETPEREAGRQRPLDRWLLQEGALRLQKRVEPWLQRLLLEVMPLALERIPGDRQDW